MKITTHRQRRRRAYRPLLGLLAVACTLYLAAPVHAEIAFSLGSGWAFSPEVDADLALASGATIPGDGDGGNWAILDLRLSWWLPSAGSRWGLALAGSLASDAVTVFDTAASVVPGQPAPSTVVEADLHQVTVQLLRRWNGVGSVGDPLQTHAGIGAGLVIADLGGRLGARPIARQEPAPTVEATFGVESQVFANVAFLVEGRAGWAELDVDLPDGARLEGDLVTGRIVFGVVLREKVRQRSSTRR